MLVQATQSPIMLRRLAGIIFLHRRLRHQPVHRTINVQLLTDIPRVGRLGSIQSVAPGRMRSIFYPQKKAVYLSKGVAPRLPPLRQPESSLPSFSQEEVDFANIKSRLEAMAPLVFHRRLRTSSRHSPAVSIAIGQAIYGSVTLHDVARRLSESHNLSLVPPNALLSLEEVNLRGKIKATGPFNVLVRLRTGDVLPLRILVEPESESQDQTQADNQTSSILVASNPPLAETPELHV